MAVSWAFAPWCLRIRQGELRETRDARSSAKVHDLQMRHHPMRTSRNTPGKDHHRAHESGNGGEVIDGDHAAWRHPDRAELEPVG